MAKHLGFRVVERLNGLLDYLRVDLSSSGLVSDVVYLSNDCALAAVEGQLDQKQVVFVVDCFAIELRKNQSPKNVRFKVAVEVNKHQ